MIHAPTCEKLKRRFNEEYKGDFKITCEDLVTSFLGMKVEQDSQSICLHLDTLEEYMSTIKKCLAMDPPSPRPPAAHRDFVAKNQPFAMKYEHSYKSNPTFPWIPDFKQF